MVDIAEQTAKSSELKTDMKYSMTLEPRHIQGNYDGIFNQFKFMLEGKFDIDDLVQQTISSAELSTPITKKKAKAMFWEVFKKVYMPPEHIGEIIDETYRAYAYIYFQHLPSVYRAKQIGKLKEVERLSQLEPKAETTRWNFKIQSLKEHYEVKIVNFEGKANTLLEQIFEIINTNYHAIVRLCRIHRDLENSVQLLSFAKYHLGGFNQDYFPAIAIKLAEDRMTGFLEFFFSNYLPLAMNFFSDPWSDSLRFISKAAQDIPDAHQFLTAFRLALMIPEARMYCIKKVEEIGEVIFSAKVETKNFDQKKKERQRMRSNLPPKVLLPREIIEDIMFHLNLRELADCIAFNPAIASLLDKVISRAKLYIKENDLDPNNLGLFMLFLHVYGLLVFFLAQVCQTVILSHELRYLYIFLTESIVDSPFEVDYLESSMPGVAYNLEVLETLSCLIPSIIWHMLSTSEVDSISKGLVRYADNIDCLTEALQGNSLNEPPSPFLDKFMLMPIDAFSDFIDLLQAKNAFDGSEASSYPTTFALLEVFVDELREMKASFKDKMAEFMRENLSQTTKLLLLLTTNITSLYSEEQLAEMPHEIYRYLDISGNYLENFCASIEKITFSIAQSATTSERTSNVDSLLPLLLNKVRKISPFLVNSIQLDADNFELLERMIESCSMYMLWRMLPHIDFEAMFSKEVDTMTFNMQYLQYRTDRMLRLKQVAKILDQNLNLANLELMKTREFQRFAENDYLKLFWQT